MRAHEMRQLSEEDLQKELDGSHREILNLRFRLATKQLTNTSAIRTVRKKIATLNTLIRERHILVEQRG